MELVCANCGERMVVPQEPEDGQHVRCPHCGAKTTYSRPSRIALPNTESSIPRAQPEPKPETTKPKIGVIRDPDRVPVYYDPGSGRQVHIAEENVRAYEEMQHRWWLRRVIANVTTIVVVLVIVLAAGAFYWYWQDRQESKMRAEIARVEAEKARAEEAAEAARTANVRRAAEEKIALERQQQLAREAAERKQAEEKARLEAEKVQAAKAEAERIRRENVVKENVAAYKGILSYLRENEFDLFFSGVTNAAVQANGMLAYYIETEERPVPLYVVEFSNAIARVTGLTADGRRFDAGDISQFQERLESLDYLVADEHKTYYRARRKKCRTGRLSALEDADPADAFFGSLAGQVKELNPVFDVLSFDIVFLPKGKQQEILCETVEYGCSYSAKKVRETVEDAFPCRPRRSSSKAKLPKFKRTVKIWDGPQIKRGIDGITYVTRTFHPRMPEYDDHVVYGPGWHYWRRSRRYYKSVYRNEINQATWSSLFEQAKAEDAAEAKFYQDIRDRELQDAKDVSESVRNAWKARIDRILKEGALFYRIKKEKTATPSVSSDL